MPSHYYYCYFLLTLPIIFFSELLSQLSSVRSQAVAAQSMTSQLQHLQSQLENSRLVMLVMYSAAAMCLQHNEVTECQSGGTLNQ